MSQSGELPFAGHGVTAEVLAGVEALLFAAGEPVGVIELADALADVDAPRVKVALELLRERYSEAGRGIVLVEVGRGWQLRTAPRFSDSVLRLRGGRPARLTRPALEVLSIVAWEQPVTRGDIDAVRGVDSGNVLKSLLEKGLVRTAGRRDEPGRPLTYKTTPLFLETFSLGSLRDLPTLAERAELEEGRDPDELALPNIDVDLDDEAEPG